MRCTGAPSSLVVNMTLHRSRLPFVAFHSPFIVRECGSVVRRQLYLRRLAAREGVGKLPHASKRAPTSIALLLGQPGEMEHLVEQCLDNLVGEGGKARGWIAPLSCYFWASPPNGALLVLVVQSTRSVWCLTMSPLHHGC